jgi:hypothetical protein
MNTLQTGHVPDRAYLHLLKDISFSPIFIMGDHRSGTTLLYSLLNMTQCYNVVTAYQIICYNSILAHHALGTREQMREELAERFTALGLTNRKIDGVQVTPDLPEEYGFLLSKMHNGPLRPGNLPRFV